MISFYYIGNDISNVFIVQCYCGFMGVVDPIKGVFGQSCIVDSIIVVAIAVVCRDGRVGRNGSGAAIIGGGRSRRDGLGYPMWIIGMGNPR
jgi:hypothetical protein